MPSFTVAANAHTVVTTGWTSPSNAFATTADSVFATAAPARNATVSGDFGFPNITSGQVPDGAIISSVVINVNWGMTAGVNGGTLGAQLFNNGTGLGTETTQTTTGQANDSQVVTSGVSISDLRSASTLLKARIRCSKGNTNTAMTGDLDFVSLTVNYVLPKQPVNVTTTSARTTRTRQLARRAGSVAAVGLFAPWIAGTVAKPIPFGTSASATVTTPSATVNQPIPLSIHATATGGGQANAAQTNAPIAVVRRLAAPQRTGGVQALGLVVQPAGAAGTITATLAKAIPLTGVSSAVSIDGAIPGAGSLIVTRLRPPKLIRKPIVIKAPSGVAGRTATVAKQIVVGRSASATVRVDATVAKAIPVGRSATAQVRVDATVAKPIPIGRAIQAAVAASATVAKPIPFTRTITAQVRVDATLAKPIPFGRAITATALSAGSLTLTKPIPVGRSSAAQVRVDATLAKPIPIGRTATVQVRVDATLAQPIPFTRAISATALGNGQAILAKPIPFGRSIAAQVRVDGTVAKAIPLGRTIVAVFPATPPPISARTTVIVTDEGIRTVLVTDGGQRTVLIADDGVRSVIVEGS